jgi:hypothetical protein
MSVYEKFLDDAKLAARKVAFSKVKAGTQARRDAERLLKRHGQAKPFSDLNMSDIDDFRRKGTFDALAANPAFGERVRELEGERAAALETVKASESQAVLAAALSAPREVLISRRHELERQEFRARAPGGRDLSKAPKFTQDAYRQLVLRQKVELEGLEDAGR